jgi:hypothetical protein
MDAVSPVSADLVPVSLFAPCSRLPPAGPRRATLAGPPLAGLVRSTPERTQQGLESWQKQKRLGQQWLPLQDPGIDSYPRQFHSQADLKQARAPRTSARPGPCRDG